jgi:hypothetical protein
MRNQQVRQQFQAQAATMTTPHMQHFINGVTNPITSNKESLATLFLDGTEAPMWSTSVANAFIGLAHGSGTRPTTPNTITGTDTIFFIAKDAVPADKKGTYANFICDIRPQKSETH